MLLSTLLEAAGQPREYNFGKIRVTATPSVQHQGASIPIQFDLTTSISSFKGMAFLHGKLNGIAYFNKSTGWTCEFHTSVENHVGDTVLLKGESSGQTMEIAIQNSLKDFVKSNSNLNI